MAISFYAGIGNRDNVPDHILRLMKDIAAHAAKNGYTLRSGAALGSDSAFEEGCDRVGGKKDIYLPWKGYNKHTSKNYHINPEAMLIAQDNHPYWWKMKQGAKKLFARNVQILLGYDLKTPVDFVICYAHNITVGGTAHAARVAREYNIPVFNLADYNAEQIMQIINR